ncbi:MAG: response regulator [Pirellulales bacterium]|nr:response regulator [Pirellulales bacterium]
MVRILVVDDEEGYRCNLSLCFEAEGFDVRTAATTTEALDVTAQFKPDVVIADWMLREERNGLDLLHAIHERVPSVEGILITGYPSSELWASAKRADVFEALEKPFDIDDLLSIVRYAAQSRHSKQ